MEEEINVDQTPVPQEPGQEEKPRSIVHSVLVILLALLIVAAVASGAFYFAVKNNINGFAYTVRPQIENHPILKLALPEELKLEDPDDPKYLSEKELLKKYDEYRSKVKTLTESLDTANATIEKMQSEFDSKAESEDNIKAAQEKNQALLETIQEEQAKLDADKKALSEIIAKGDTEGFKKYFESVDKTAAESIYKEILTEEDQQNDQAALAKPFSAMEPESAAGVLTELYKKDKNTLLNIFKGLKPKASALILEKMDAKTAADITQLLSGL